MSLSVVEMSNETGKTHVTIRSEGLAHNLAIPELQSPEARRLATEHAARNGVINARCEVPSAPYAVTAEGKPVVDPRTQKIDHYRTDVPICVGL